MMRLHGTLPQDRVQIESDPDFEQEYLGDPPELTQLDMMVWDVYWSERNGMPSDQPIDLLRALAWFERLYCRTDAQAFGRQVRAMDAEFFKARAASEGSGGEKSKSKGRGK